MNYRLLIVLAILVLAVPANAATITLMKNVTYEAQFIQTANAVWGIMTNGTGGTITKNPASYVRAGYTAANDSVELQDMNNHYRYGLSFNFSEFGIPSDATINSITVSLYRYGSIETSLGIVNLSIIDWTPKYGAWAAGDFDNTSFMRLATDVPYASVGSTWNNISLTNLTFFNKTGNSTIMVTHNADVDKTSLGWVSASDSGYRFYSSTSIHPVQVTVVYTEAAGADTTPPEAVTGLANGTTNSSSTVLTWNNPTGVYNTDLFRENLFLNNILNSNQSNTTQTLTLVGLTNNTLYSVSVTTEDLTGNRNVTHHQNITFTTDKFDITTPSPPTSSFTQDDNEGYDALPVTFTSTSSGTIDSVRWLTRNVTPGNNTWFSFNTTKTNSYFVFPVGTWDVMLETKNTGGATNSSVAQTVVHLTVFAPPDVDFTANYTARFVGQYINFTSLSGWHILGYKWEFGDFTNSTDYSPQKAYSAAGTYSVTLTVTNASGESTLTKTNYVTISAAAISSFTKDRSIVRFPGRIMANSTSTDTTGYDWYWGDGTSNDTTRNVTHQFIKRGNQNVCLIASNGGGSSTSCQAVKVIGYDSQGFITEPGTWLNWMIDRVLAFIKWFDDVILFWY